MGANTGFTGWRVKSPPQSLDAPTCRNYGIIAGAMVRPKQAGSFLYIVPAALFLLLLFIAACGGDDDGAVETPSSAETPAATQPLATTTSAPPGEAPQSPPMVRLPDDEGVHLTTVEWWYFNGHVDTPDGLTFSYHFVTFLSKLDSGLTPQLMQLSWADHEEGVHLVEEKASFSLVEESNGSFDLTNGDWHMSGDGETYRLSFVIDDYAVELEGPSTKPPVLHHDTGYVDLGIAGKTYYYSRTDIELSGTVSVDGLEHPVTGTTWMDHQWGDFSTAHIGWDWFSLNMDDGLDLMVSVVWEQDSGRHIETYGTYVPADGGPAVHLPGNDISVEPTATWTSSESGGEYPMGWRLFVESLGIDIMLTPAISDAEFTLTGFVPIIYWEGAVEANGFRNGAPVSGRGFVEMVGYVPNELPDAATSDVGTAQVEGSSNAETPNKTKTPPQ